MSFAFITCQDTSETTDKAPQQFNETNLTLDKKIGQMLMIGFRGTDLTEENHIYNDIKKFHIGGVVLYDYDLFSEGKMTRNIQTPEQVKTLCQSIQELADTDLLISIDQEGGRVNRLMVSRKLGFLLSI